MAARFKKPPGALAGRYEPDSSLRFRRTDLRARGRMPARWDEQDLRFLALVAALSLTAFAIVFAWNWLPGWSAAAEPPSPEVQRLLAMNEHQMQKVVWPDTPASLEAQQPELDRKDPGEPAAHGAGIPVSARFGECVGVHRVTCVVDGDTIWYQGTKIRIADINAPEVSEPQCAYEAKLGARATERLTVLLNAGPFSLWPVERDYDKYGSRLLVAKRGGKSLGDELVAEGLAERWRGYRRNWCTG